MTPDVTLEDALARARAMHRRAQRAEGSLDRRIAECEMWKRSYRSARQRILDEETRAARAEQLVERLKGNPVAQPVERRALAALARDAVELPRLLPEALPRDATALLRRMLRMARAAGLTIPEASANAVAPRLHEILRDEQGPIGPGDER